MSFFEDNDRDEIMDEEPVDLTFDSVMCRNGHLRTEDNTIIAMTWYGGKRLRCRDCEREREKRRTHDRRPEAARADAYPMHFGEGYYKDTGCDIHPSCLECPLPQCRYDTPGGAAAFRSAGRKTAALELRRQGKSVEEIHRALGVSRRSVFRILAAAAQLV